MDTKMMWMLTRTPLHVGSGSSVGIVDMPVARESHTQIPVIPGSGLKGVLRDLWFEDADKSEQVDLFGPESDAEKLAMGDLVVGEGRVVCFPVRSAKNAFAWITCPLALQRVAREKGASLPDIQLSDDQCLTAEQLLVKRSSVVLEEYAFKMAGPLPAEVLDLLSDACDDDLWATLPTRLVVVSDGLFAHFCANGCEVQQRIKLKNGVVDKGGLFNQENVPSETLFYAVMGSRTKDGLGKLSERIAQHGHVVQIGGDATVGLGWCGVKLAGGDE